MQEVHKSLQNTTTLGAQGVTIPLKTWHMKSVWETGAFHRTPHLAVIGGGITGLFTALFHKRAFPHHHVLVLERGAFPSGASVKNAGFACFGSPSELLTDMEREGEERALQRVEERWLGLQELRSELGDDRIGFEPTGGHEVFHASDPLYTLVAERFDALNADLLPILGSKAFHWDDQGIATKGLSGVDRMVRTGLEGALDSGSLMAELLRKAISEGVSFRSSADVVSMEEAEGRVDLRLADGTRILAPRVVVATNGYSHRLVPDSGIRPARGQVLLTHPVPGLKLRGTFHYEEGYYYFRDLGGAVLLGGGRNLDPEGETTDKDGTSLVIQQRLERLLREVIIPDQAFSVAQRWSGVMGFHSTGKDPLIERHGERIVIAAGLSGMGVAIGIRVARKAAALVAE